MSLSLTGPYWIKVSIITQYFKGLLACLGREWPLLDLVAHGGVPGPEDGDPCGTLCHMSVPTEVRREMRRGRLRRALGLASFVGSQMAGQSRLAPPGAPRSGYPPYTEKPRRGLLAWTGSSLRVRGEQGASRQCSRTSRGSSPRARGTGSSCNKFSTQDRFIPACAGNSGSWRLSTPSTTR